MTQILAFWEGLDLRRKLIAGLSVLAILAAIVGIARVSTTPAMVLLYSGLDPAAAGEVVAALEASNVPFEVRNNAIYVASDARDRTRMALAAQGLPAGGPAGYEILDTLTGFGTTSQMFDAAYWRAKEGELARTITSSPNIRSARVHLANPVSQPFARSATASASVTVTMARGSLGQPQAEAIRYLVSSAVAGLGPETVAVIDSAEGAVLAGADDELARAGMQTPSDREETLRANIQRLLEARVGEGRAIVEVNVAADMDSETVSERIIDPTSRVAISSEVEESQESATGSDPGVTVASNLPDGDVQGAGGETSRTSSQNVQRQNFEVSETRRERVILPGQVQKISVAVIIDGVVEAGPDGAPVWSPRPEEELETLRGLVETAIGFDADRGDTVTIESLQFSELPEQGTVAEAAGPGFVAANGGLIAQLGVLAAIVLALIFFVLRPMLNRKGAPALADFSGGDDFSMDLGGVLPEGGFTTVDIAELDGAGGGNKVERLRDAISNRSEESAALLRSWIETPDVTPEPAKT